MKPKAIFQEVTIQEDHEYVFAIFPSEVEKRYVEYIQDPIRNIIVPTGNMKCESYLDFAHITKSDMMSELWKGIAKATIVIADISNYKHNVMLELGVALSKKDRVLIVAEENNKNDNIDGLPYDLLHTKVFFYNHERLDELTEHILKNVEALIENLTISGVPSKNPDVLKLLKDAEDLIVARSLKAASLLFQEMDRIEPKSCYINREWGRVYTMMKDFDLAQEKYNWAIEVGRTSKQRSLVYVEVAEMFRIAQNNNQALVYFKKAEEESASNAELYDKWAYMYYTLGQFQEAMLRMMSAVKLNSTIDYRIKLEYYAQRFADGNFTMSMGVFFKKRRSAIIDGPKPPKGGGQIGKPGTNERTKSIRKFESAHGVNSTITGTISNRRNDIGIFVLLGENITGLVYRTKLPRNFDMNHRFDVGKNIKVRIVRYDFIKGHISLELVN